MQDTSDENQDYDEWIGSNSFSVNPTYDLQPWVRRPDGLDFLTHFDIDTSGDYTPGPLASGPVHTPEIITLFEVSSENSNGSTYGASDCGDSGFWSIVSNHTEPNAEFSDASSSSNQHAIQESSRYVSEPQYGPVRPRFIVTRIAHPLIFNSDEGPCNWCEDFSFGLFGLGEKRKVEVLDYGRGDGFVEIGNGYSASGFDISRMCQWCTLRRLTIINCPLHDMKLIRGMKNVKVSSDELMECSLPEKAGSAPFPWCSICPNPAYYVCCHPSGDAYLDIEEEEYVKELRDLTKYGVNDGCGLVLCEKCVVMNGCLGELIDGLDKDPEGEFGPRADANLLHPNGELLKRVQWPRYAYW